MSNQGSPAVQSTTSRVLRPHPMARTLEDYVVTATVTAIGDVTASTRAIRIAADPQTFPYRPGQHIRIEINAPRSL